MAAAQKKTPAPSKQSAARAAFVERNTIGNTAAIDPVAQTRAELEAATDGVKAATIALIVAQRRHEDAKISLFRAIEDRDFVECA